MALHQEERSEGGEVSPMEAPAPGKSLQVEAEGSGEALPGGIALPRQRVIEIMQEILVCIHALCLQTMHEMGSIFLFQSLSNLGCCFSIPLQPYCCPWTVWHKHFAHLF